MKTSAGGVARLVREQAELALKKDLHKIEASLDQLSTAEIWWRPNARSNSAGNLCLHLCGNMRQWIISGLGGAKDIRVRDAEFSERGPIPRRELERKLGGTVAGAVRVIRRLTPDALGRKRVIQGFHVTGYGALAQVVQHFSHHAGQIIYLAKMKRGRDLSLTKLPQPPTKRGAK
jgi:uncharacterized damage-inducible protein DinB